MDTEEANEKVATNIRLTRRLVWRVDQHAAFHGLSRNAAISILLDRALQQPSPPNILCRHCQIEHYPTEHKPCCSAACMEAALAELRGTYPVPAFPGLAHTDNAGDE